MPKKSPYKILNTSNCGISVVTDVHEDWENMMDDSGELILGKWYDVVFHYPTEGLWGIHQDGYSAFVDRYGNFEIDFFRGEARPFQEGMSNVEVDGGWG
ncbi:MAG: hypothetical protein ABEH43_04610, partial [Flavobacteriales bacterium]